MTCKPLHCRRGIGAFAWQTRVLFRRGELRRQQWCWCSTTPGRCHALSLRRSTRATSPHFTCRIQRVFDLPDVSVYSFFFRIYTTFGRVVPNSR